MKLHLPGAALRAESSPAGGLLRQLMLWAQDSWGAGAGLKGEELSVPWGVLPFSVCPAPLGSWGSLAMCLWSPLLWLVSLG